MAQLAQHSLRPPIEPYSVILYVEATSFEEGLSLHSMSECTSSHLPAVAYAKQASVKRYALFLVVLMQSYADVSLSRSHETLLV